MGIIRQNKRKINDGMMIQRKVKLIFHFMTVKQFYLLEKFMIDGFSMISDNVKYKRWFLKENIVLYIVMTRQLLTTKINLK